jgi:ABC-2 type transport system ATP-binding protein
MSDIEALAQRILLIGKGRLLYDGELGAMRDKYANAEGGIAQGGSPIEDALVKMYKEFDIT